MYNQYIINCERMKSMKKIIVALLLCASLVAMTFAGCSEDAAEKVDVNNEQAVEEKDAEETAPEKQEEVIKENEAETSEENKEENSEAEPEQPEEPVEEPKLAEDIAVNPEKPEEVVNQLEFENVKLLAGIANAMGKTTAEVTQEDIDSIGYIGISAEETGDYTVYLGLSDFTEAYSQNLSPEEYEHLVKKSVMDFDAETDSFADLSKFKNVISFEYYGIPVTDVSFIKEYKNLKFGYFNNNGITDVSALEGYNPESLRELDFTGNEIADWSPLYPIKEKVYVHYGEITMYNEAGEPVSVPNVLTLAQKLEQDEAAAQKPQESEKTQEEPVVFTDENGEAVDFSSLFE